MIKRVEIHLTKDEKREHRRLKNEPEVGFAFWRKVCRNLGLDPATAMLDPDTNQMTALPEGHGKHWCWPWPLVCKDPPEKQLKFLKLED